MNIKETQSKNIDSVKQFCYETYIEKFNTFLVSKMDEFIVLKNQNTKMTDDTIKRKLSISNHILILLKAYQESYDRTLIENFGNIIESLGPVEDSSPVTRPKLNPKSKKTTKKIDSEEIMDTNRDFLKNNNESDDVSEEDDYKYTKN